MALSWRNPHLSIALLLIAGLAVGAPAPAAESAPVTALEIGLPLLHNFTLKDYGASAQNWAIVQDPRGLIYAGNNLGVLEFDGVRWRIIEVANGTVVRSLATDAAGRVYVGAYGELGVLEPDAMGQTRYVSWMGRIPAGDRGFGQVLQTLATERGIIFSTSSVIFRVGPQVQVWKPRTAFDRVLKAGERLFVREQGRGLMELKGNEWQLLPGGERFADEIVSELLPGVGTGSFLVGTRAQGLFLFDGTSFRPFPTAIDASLKRDLLRSAARLVDGSLALATTQNGLYLLDAQGRFRTHLTTDNGLQNATVTAILQDREGGLWMTLSKGIARVELGALTAFTKGNGLDSTVISMLRHRGTLYVGTNSGLSHLEVESGGNARFVSVPEIKSQTWAFLDAGPALLVANAAGVYEFQNGLPKLVRPSTGTAMALYRSKRDPLRVFVGLQNGLGSMRWEEGRWVDEGMVPGITEGIRSLFETADGRLWGGTYATGIIRLSFPAGSPTQGPKIERFGTAQGLPDLRANEVFSLDGQPLFATHRGLYRFAEDTGRFEPDPRFTRLFPAEPRRVEFPKQDRRGWVWMASTDVSRRYQEVGAAVPDPDGSYHWESQQLGGLREAPSWSIYCDENDVTWFSGPEGLFRYDPQVPRPHSPPFRSMVRKVTGPKDRLFFGGAGPGGAPTLKYEDNSLRFEYAAPSFDGLEANLFQVFLEGEDRTWTPWSAETYRDYRNLGEGSYKFRVRARNSYGAVSEEGSFFFTIQPPWYRTWWAYGGYLLLAGAAVEGLFFWRMRALRRKTRLLEADIAERKRIQTALQESEKRFRLAFMTSPDAFYWSTMEDGRLLEVNQGFESVFGYTRAEVIGRTSLELGLYDNPADRERMLSELKTMGRVREMELRGRKKGGAAITITLSVGLVQSGDNHFILGVIRDITEKRILEEKFLHAQRLESVGMLAAGIAHDLNNVLAPIMMAAPMLRAHLSNPRDLKLLDTIEQSTGRGAGLVKQILGFVRTTSGDFQPTQVKHLVRDVISVIEDTFPKSIQLDHQVPTDLWPVAGNASQIHQVLLNLCVNARDAMPQGGRLHLVAANRRLDAAEAAAIPDAQPGDWLMLEVSDTGTGIPPEVLEKIWTPFFTTKGIGKGTGLGLSTVRSIVHGHHGFIVLDTEVGRGSTFRVFLPAAASEAPAATEASPTGATGGRNEIILVVDDNPAIRDTIGAIIEESGYRAVYSADGVEALAQFAAQRDAISLVITDVDMPRLGGVGLAQALLKMRPDIRILALSGQSNSSDGALEIPEIQKLAHAYLPKPFKPEELLGAIRRLLQPTADH